MSGPILQPVQRCLRDLVHTKTRLHCRLHGILTRPSLWAAATAIVVLALGYGVLVMFIPLGVELDDLGAFLFASISTESIGPGGDVIRHVLNDAGAAHSGLHYVWVLHRRSAWLPWQVLVSGWS